MRIVVLPSVDDASHAVADEFVNLLMAKPNAVLGLAAGRTPELTYRLLCERGLDVSHAAAVLLDEYVGLSPTDERSFRHQIQTIFTDPLGLDPSRLYSLDGRTADSGATCRAVRAIDRGPRRRRSTTSGSGPQWPYRIQRARVVAQFSHPVDPTRRNDPSRQCRGLRLRRPCADAHVDPGYWHDPAGSPNHLVGDGSPQGRRCCRRGDGTDNRRRARQCTAAPSQRSGGR